MAKIINGRMQMVPPVFDEHGVVKAQMLPGSKASP